MKFNIAIGILFILLSIKTIITGNFSDVIYGPNMNLENGKYIFSMIFLISGIFIFYNIFKNYKKNNYIIKYKICPKCEESYNSSDLKDDICPNCDIKTVNLEGYFDKKR